jgi:preprotein translocase subunit SecE
LQVRFLSALRVSTLLARGNDSGGVMVQDEPSGEVVAAGGAVREKKLNVFQRIALFIRQVFGELRKVVTPTRRELVQFTIVVLVFVIVMMAIVYGLDVLFVWLTTLVFGVPGGASV